MQGFFPGSQLAQSVAPPALVPRCGACGLYKTCKSPKMPVRGQGGRRILLVAEAPGAEEDEQNEQLVGNAGKCFRRALARTGIDMERDCWKTNAIICRPPDDKKPSKDQIAHCLPNLTKTIETLQPEIIIPAGEIAIRALIGSVWREDMGAVARWVGWRIPEQTYNAWVCPVYHPSYILRLKDEDDPAILWWHRHLTAVDRLQGRPWPGGAPDYLKCIECIYNADQAAHIIDQMVARGGTAAFDYETTTLKPDWPEAAIVSCSICWEGKRTIAYPWQGAAIAATQRFLQSPIRKIASNMKFEERWTIKEFGHRVRNWWWDTLLGGHLADCRRNIASIKFQSFIRFGMPVYDDHIKPFLKARAGLRVNDILREVELKDLLLYNGLDSLLEYMVALDQRKEMGYE